MSSVFDIIFAGGGTTACVVAGRLAAADPSLKILIVESGQHSRDLPNHVEPYHFRENLTPNSTTISVHEGKPSPHLNGRAPIVSCGKSVGGGSTINFMLYSRSAVSDYNDWAAFGNKGWSFNELLPWIKKTETFTPTPDQATHGYSGPVKISSAPTGFGIGNQFLAISKAYDSARPQVSDCNDFKTPNAYGPAHRYIDPMTGKRSDAASRYLYPQSGNPNVQIVVGKLVKRVIIENGRATGIEYTSGADINELVTVSAKKFVVVSAGTFGSPAILERSGIGASSILDKNTIPVLVDLPGVGENFQDHVGTFPVFYGSDDIETMDDVWTDSKDISVYRKEWEEHGTGKLAHNGVEAMVKMRPTATELKSAGPALQTRWKTFFESNPDKPMALLATCSGCPTPFRPTPSDRKLISIVYFLVYPDSRGSVHVTSGEDPSSPLDFDPDYCSKPGDIEQLTLLYKLARELFRRLPAYRGDLPAFHPKFPPGSAAACNEVSTPVPIDAPNIVYSKEDDEAIVDFHRSTVGTIWHSIGTCAMKPRDQGGVVDSRLNVYGVEGIKVADLSICPSNVGNNTYSTALLVGEKAASIIAEDLGMTLAEEIPAKQITLQALAMLLVEFGRNWIAAIYKSLGRFGLWSA